jgi:hypothetical protein
MVGNLEGCKLHIQTAIANQDTKICLDMTSLYPSAMKSCPLPMGRLISYSVAECQQIINSVGCVKCEDLMTLCEDHRFPSPNLRPFAIILVKNMNPTDKAKEGLVNLVGRKIRPITFKQNKGIPVFCDNHKKSEGTSYTLETEQETTKRVWGNMPTQPAPAPPPSAQNPETTGIPLIETTDWNVYGAIQSYTNIDLYWAKKCGFEFEIVGGFGWNMSTLMCDLYEGLFKMRAEAKEDQNQSLQLALKLVLNGGYGVHCQKVINSSEKVVDMPVEYHDCDIKDSRVLQFLRDHHHDTFDSRFILKENIPLPTKQSFIRAKIPTDLGEVIGGSSPNQVGAAVLAWSRHLMNLIMFPLMKQEDGAVTYTDTDSITISQKMYDFIAEKKPHLLDMTGKTLSTFKNDHSDIFPNGRIIFSALGGKKVKMHLVACPDTGNLKICNTYKGFMTDTTDEEGNKYTPDKAGYLLSSALLDILYDGKPKPHCGTRWTRSLGDHGVRIERGVDFTPTSEAYLSHCSHYVPVSMPPHPFHDVLPRPMTEHTPLEIVCVPHGSTKIFPVHFPVFYPQKDEKSGELYMGDAWRLYLDKHLDGDPNKQRVNRNSLLSFFARYYSKKDGFYGQYTAPTSTDGLNLREEMERKKKFEKEFYEWSQINQKFDLVNRELQAGENSNSTPPEIHTSSYNAIITTTIEGSPIQIPPVIVNLQPDDSGMVTSQTPSPSPSPSPPTQTAPPSPFLSQVGLYEDTDELPMECWNERDGIFEEEDSESMLQQALGLSLNLDDDHFSRDDISNELLELLGPH